MFITSVLAIVLSVFIVTLLYYRDKKLRIVGSRTPGPDYVPFFGNAFQVIGTNANELFEIITDIGFAFGERSRVFIGTQLIYFLSSPKDVEVIMSNPEFNQKASEYDFLHPWLGQGLLTSSGETWRKHRKIITPAFHFKILENFIDVFNTQSNILVDKLKKYDGLGNFDVYPLMALYALDVISETAMGVSINSQNASESEYVLSVQDQAQIMRNRMKNPFKKLDFLFRMTSDYRRQKKNLVVLHGLTNRMIQERKAVLQNANETLSSYTTFDDTCGLKRKMAFLDLLLLSTIDGQPLSDIAIREEVDTFLFEGHDTTTSALSFALFLIGENSDVQEKLYQEQLNIFGDNKTQPCTYSDLQNMKYLELAIKETLRLYPSVPLLGRKIVKNTFINDLEIPEGSSIAVSVFNMNRNYRVFPCPDQFIPERFLPEECSKRNPFATISFSAGQRNCIGQKFAMIEMKANLSMLIRNYKIFSTGHKLTLVADLILKSSTGIHIKIQSRE